MNPEIMPTAILMSIAYIDNVIGSVDGKNLFIKILLIYASKRPTSPAIEHIVTDSIRN